MIEVSRPTCEGWWARRRHEKVEWFYVQRLEDERKTGSYYLAIWVSDIEDFLLIDQFNSPLTKWAGPVEIPWSEE